MDFSDIWDYIVDGFDYLIHFEWIGEGWEYIKEFFSDFGESMFSFEWGFSTIIALIMGLIGAYLSWITLGKIEFIGLGTRILGVFGGFIMSYFGVKRVIEF